MISEVTYEDSKRNDLPYKFEAGTPNIADSIGLGVACEYLQEIGMENIWNHEIELGQYAVEQISSLGSFKVLGNKSKELRGGVVSFIHDTIHPHDIGSLLDGYGIAIRTGHHCAMPLVRSYDVVAASIEASERGCPTTKLLRSFKNLLWSEFDKHVVNTPKHLRACRRMCTRTRF